MPAGHTYIMGSATGTLYIGVTSVFDTRILQHRNGSFEGFSKTYVCTASSTPKRTTTSAQPSPAKSNSKAGAAKRNST